MADNLLTGIKPSFARGEFAPSLYSRVDLTAYAIGARTLRNFTVHPHGGASNRPGFEYIATEKTDGKKIRLIPFEFSTQQTYMLEFGEQYIRFFQDGEPITLEAADSYVEILLHGNGADESQVITDETGKVVTVVGTAQLDTAQKVFGTAAILLDGDSDYLTLVDSDVWDPDGDFAIDTRVRFAALPTAGNAMMICQHQTDSANYWNWQLVNLAGAYYLRFTCEIGGVAVIDILKQWITPVIGTWYHIEIDREGSDWYEFIDGQQIGTTVTDASAIGNYNQVFAIGAGRIPDSPSSFLNGWMEEFRFTNGIARHTSNFDLPIEEYDITGDADAWVTTTEYAVGDFVTEDSAVYICLIAHTSGTFATDLANGKWEEQDIYQVVTPYLEDDLAGLNYTQSADVLFITHPDFAPRQLERTSDTEWNLNLYDYQNGPFQLANTTSTKTVKSSALSGEDKTLTASGFTFNSLQIGSLWKLEHYIEGASVEFDIDDVEPTTSILCGGTWRLLTHGTWTATIKVEKSTDGGVTWTVLRVFDGVNDFNPDTYGTEDMIDNEEPFLIRVNCTAYANGPINVTLSADPYYTTGIVEITAVAANGVTATIDIIRTVGNTTTTADWSEGSWSDYRGWPAVVEFHPEDRLMFANTYTEPQTYWLTQSGNYYDFATNSPLQDSDAISSPLPSRKVNGINGLVPLTEMIALTLSNEVSIRSSSGPISPSTAYNRIHGWEGSYGTKPVIVGNRVIYVQSTGSIVRDLGYDLYSDSFTGADLSIFSNHLFIGYAITEMAYQQNPDRIVWCVRDDGILLSMTYMREQEVVAWTWHDTNAGDDLFESVACIRGDGYDEVWVAVNRNGTRYIERMHQRMDSTALEDQFYVDCGTSFNDTATTTFSVPQLASKEVSVLADGVEITGKTVSAAGVLTLDTAASKVHVGIGYTCDLETLNVEVNLPDGTAQGRQVKISQVVLRMLNSYGAQLGPNEDDLYDIKYSDNPDYTEGELFSGDIKETLSLTYEDGGRIFIRQTSPLPITVTGIIPEITIGGITQT